MLFWIIVVSIPIAYYFLKPKKEKAMVLQKPDFNKDVVYLVQFPVSPQIRTISPFALKLETYLRMNKVNYEPVYALAFSKKGQIPYIELNGEQIADSNIIIKELEQKGITKHDEVSEDQKAVNHLAIRTVENHLAWTGFLWRYGFHMPEFYDKLCEPYYGKSRSLFFFKNVQPTTYRFNSKIHGIGRHSMEEVTEFAGQDLKGTKIMIITITRNNVINNVNFAALSNILGDKKFFNGDEPTNIDCAMFGHLVQFVYMPLDIPHKHYILKECKNLSDFVDRMKDRFWSDWNEMCKGSCMNGHRGITYEQ